MACTLGVCAERNAIFNKITNGEDSIKRVIAIDRAGKAIPPCGACREFMTQLMPEEYKTIPLYVFQSFSDHNHSYIPRLSPPLSF